MTPSLKQPTAEKKLHILLNKVGIFDEEEEDEDFMLSMKEGGWMVFMQFYYKRQVILLLRYGELRAMATFSSKITDDPHFLISSYTTTMI